MRRILITGGAGFVGSSLGLRLRAAFPAAEVVALDNFYRQGSELNGNRLRQAGVTIVRGDVRDPAVFGADPFDLVIDAAAEPSVLAGRDGDVRYVVDTNLGGTLHLLEAVRRWGAMIVFLSSSRVYPVAALQGIQLIEKATRFEIDPDQAQPGLSTRGVAEEFTLEGARTLYGATKMASEIMVREYAAQFGIRAVINRCGVLAGPWQMGKVDQGVIALWVARHHYGMPLTYLGYGGRQVRDVLHVEDLADLLLLQLKCETLRGEVFTVGGGRDISVSLRELTTLARAATGRTVAVGNQDQVRYGDIPLYLTDATRVRQAFGWQPQRSMAQIVDDTARWIHDYQEPLRPVLGDGAS